MGHRHPLPDESNLGWLNYRMEGFVHPGGLARENAP
jgi:hypothetical protein